MERAAIIRDYYLISYMQWVVGPKMLHNTACQLLCKMGCPFMTIMFSYGDGATMAR